MQSVAVAEKLRSQREEKGEERQNGEEEDEELEEEEESFDASALEEETEFKDAKDDQLLPDKHEDRENIHQQLEEQGTEWDLNAQTKKRLTSNEKEALTEGLIDLQALKAADLTSYHAINSISMHGASLVSKLQKKGIESLEQLLSESKKELQKELKLSSEHLSSILSSASKVLLAGSLQPSTALSLLERHKKRLSFGCCTLDQCFDGGLFPGFLYDICGEAATGKTQIAFQLLNQVQFPQTFGGLDGDGIYLHTDPFSSIRLDQISSCFSRRLSEVTASDRQPSEMTDRILTKKIDSLQEGLQTILIDLPRFVASRDIPNGKSVPSESHHPIRLIVIDSIASLLRLHQFSTSKEGMRNRCEILNLISKRLRFLADRHGLVVVILNRVSEIFHSLPNISGGSSPSQDLNDLFSSSLMTSLSEKGQKAALGQSWSNCINARFFLRKTNQTLSSEETCDTFHTVGTKRLLSRADTINKKQKYQQQSTTGTGTVTGTGTGCASSLSTPTIKEIFSLFSPTIPRWKNCQFVIDTLGVRGLK